MLLTPDWTASSTPYWMTGLSTSTSFFFGCALVAGRRRVPSPAAGNTALRIVPVMSAILSQEPLIYDRARHARSGPAPRQPRSRPRGSAESRTRSHVGARGARRARIATPAADSRHRGAQAGTEHLGRRGGARAPPGHR